MYTIADVKLEDGTTGTMRTMPCRDPASLIGTRVIIWAAGAQIRGVLAEIL